MACNTKSVNIPVSKKEITSEWVKQVTGHDAIPEDFHIEGDIQAGVGFMSSICRVSYKTKSGNKHNIIVKLLPADPAFLEMVTLETTDEREIKFYSSVLPDLLEVIPEFAENVCKYYNGAVIPADKGKGTPRASMVIVEDLRVLEFEMMDYAGEKSEKNIHSLITGLARLHFGGMAVSVKKGKSLPELYPFMQGISNRAVEEWVAKLTENADDSYSRLKQLLESQNVSRETCERYEKLRPYALPIAQTVYKMGQKFPCLIHGDVWPPNIQIYKEGQLPVKLLDWQLIGYWDPAFDLSAMLLTVVPKERLKGDYLRKLARRYYDEFVQLCKTKGHGSVIPGRSCEEFVEFVFTWGMAYTHVLFSPFIDCINKHHDKWANAFRVLCEEFNIPEFLQRECT